MKASVSRNEIGPGQAIAVKKDAKCALARANAAVANLAAAEAAVFVSDMLEREARFPALDQPGGVGSRAVVGDDNLEIAVRLSGQRPQHGRERILAVVGRDDNRNEKGAAHVLPPTRSKAMHRIALVLHGLLHRARPLDHG